uniref:ribonuclease Z n=1 Tax=Blastobotrys adeninivorans TaxID=409370 RepID=A0A060T0B4_BLAAD
MYICGLRSKVRDCGLGILRAQRRSGSSLKSKRQSKVTPIGKMKTAIQVVAHPTSDCSEPALLLHTRPGSKFLIGRCGEGLQRSMNQHKVRLSKLKGVFYTGYPRWEALGGLPGFLLTVNDQGAKDFILHSSVSTLSWATSTWRNFMFHNSLDLKIAEPSHVYEDECVIIKGIAVGSSHGTNEQAAMSSTIHRSRKEALPPIISPDVRSSCYIVQIAPGRGKFLVEKAKALGVKPGVAFRKLTEGDAVVTDEGVTVTPEQVLEPAPIPPRVLVIDCPNNNYVDDIVNSKAWTEPIHLGAGRNAGQEIPVDIKAVYHFLGKDVNPLDGKYHRWMTSTFASDCLHFICHPDYSPDGIMLESAALLNVKLRKSFPKHFPRLASSDSISVLESAGGIRALRAHDILSLEPQVTHMPDESVSDFRKGKVNWEAVESNLDYGDMSGTEYNFEQATHLTEPEIAVLGTGSAIPAKYRNVVSSIVIVPLANGSNVSIMLDCGEGTLGSMRRYYGEDGVNVRLRELGLISISHLHADHHLGTMSVIRKWLQVNPPEKTLYVVGPRYYEQFMNEWAQLEPEIYGTASNPRIKFFDMETFIIGRGFRGDREEIKANGFPEELSRDLGLSDIKACKAFHCDYSYCSAYVFQRAFKVAYSGDTRPNPFFADRVGKNCDVLIHEATHDNELAEEAKAKRHSTIGEAMEIANRMRARTTVLTHFSQRYPKVPDVGEQGEELERVLKKTVFAFDGFHTLVSEIDDPANVKKRMEGLSQLQLALSEDRDDDVDIPEEKSLKRKERA